MKAFAFGDPNPIQKGKKNMAKKKGAHHEKGSQHKSGSHKGKGHKKGKKHHKNPIESALHSVTGSGESFGLGKSLGKGVGVGLGAVVTEAFAQNLLPTSIRTGSLAKLAKGALGLGLGFGFSKVKFLKRFAEPVAVGGVSAAVRDTASPYVLPPLAFNLLGEPGYLGELDSRRLSFLGDVGAMDLRQLQTGTIPPPTGTAAYEKLALPA